MSKLKKICKRCQRSLIQTEFRLKPNSRTLRFDQCKSCDYEVRSINRSMALEREARIQSALAHRSTRILTLPWVGGAK